MTDPFWLSVLRTIIFEAGVLGGGSWVVFCKVIPWLSSKEELHELSPSEREAFRKVLWGLFAKAKRWPVHPYSFLASYVMRGVAFILLFGVLALLLTDIGWVKAFATYPTWQAFIMARSGGVPNGAHILAYLPLPLLGLYVAWKYHTDVLLDCYQGLLVVALLLSIHEGIWTSFYYIVYWQWISWAVILNIVKDIFFIVMLVMLAYTFVKYPFQKIPLKTFFWPFIIVLGFNFIWVALGFHISTANNSVYGKGIYMVTPWWGDPETNLTEILSWNTIYVAAGVAIWRLKK